MQRLKRFFVMATVILGAVSCSINKDHFINADLPIHMQFGRDSQGKLVKSYKIGSPYQINGIWYYPSEDFGYKERGVASWYGPGFQGRDTANGETYNMNDMTAAHKTLPMSSIVTVQNLINGKTIKVRINDRGPFIEGRIIDLSRRAARALDIVISGTAPVEVSIVPEDSLTIKNIALDSALPIRQNIFGAPKPKRSDIIRTKELLPILEKGGNLANGISPIVESPATALPAIEIIPLVDQSINVARILPIEKRSGPLMAREGALLLPGSEGPSSVASNIGQVTANPASDKLAVYNPSVTRFYVQVGAFADIKNAENLSDNVASMGRTEISLVNRGVQRLYRVRLGPFANRKVAEEKSKNLIRNGIKSAEVLED